MTDTNVLQVSQPGIFADPLTEVFRDGARALLAQAVEAEVATLLDRYADQVTDDGRRRLVRHGHLPEREIVTGIELRLVAADGPEHRLRLSEAEARELLRLLKNLLEPPGAGMSAASDSR
jgi:hypothetical protein